MLGWYASLSTKPVLKRQRQWIPGSKLAGQTISELWAQLRESASMNKVKSSKERLPMSTSGICAPNTCTSTYASIYTDTSSTHTHIMEKETVRQQSMPEILALRRRKHKEEEFKAILSYMVN